MKGEIIINWILSYDLSVVCFCGLCGAPFSHELTSSCRPITPPVITEETLSEGTNEQQHRKYLSDKISDPLIVLDFVFISLGAKDKTLNES